MFTEAGLDRRYYELCVLAELKNALRSGDIWVPGSRQFRDFEDYLLPTAAFASLDVSEELPLTAGGSFDRYWTERETRLRRELEKVDSLAARHQLPDAEIVDGILKVTPLANAVPEEAETLMRQAYALLPHVKSFSRCCSVREFHADFLSQKGVLELSGPGNIRHQGVLRDREILRGQDSIVKRRQSSGQLTHLSTDTGSGLWGQQTF